MGNGFGKSHAVALKTRSKREQIGAGIEFCEALRRHGAEHRDTVAELIARNIGIQLRGRIGIAASVAGDREMPRQVGERGERGDQHVKPLARHHRADGKQPYNAIVAAMRRRRRIASRTCDNDVISRHAVVGSKQPRRRRTRDNDTSCRRQRRAFAGAEFIGLRRRQPRLQRERMMHERDQRMARAKLQSHFGKNAISEPVDDDRAPRRNGYQPFLRRFALLLARPRKAFAEIDDIDFPTETLKLRDHAPVVGIAAGRGRKIARHRERDASYHNAASYQARATCDSESVTRIALSSRPSRPSLPARAASASRS